MSQENCHSKHTELDYLYGDNLGPQERYEHSAELVATARDHLADTWHSILQDGLNLDKVQASADARENYMVNVAEFFQAFLNNLRVDNPAMAQAEESNLLCQKLIEITNQRTAAENEVLAHRPPTSISSKIGQLLGREKLDSQIQQNIIISIKYDEDAIEEYWNIHTPSDPEKVDPDTLPPTKEIEPLVVAGVTITSELLAQEYATLDFVYGKHSPH